MKFLGRFILWSVKLLLKLTLLTVVCGIVLLLAVRDSPDLGFLGVLIIMGYFCLAIWIFMSAAFGGGEKAGAAPKVVEPPVTALAEQTVEEPGEESQAMAVSEEDPIIARKKLEYLQKLVESKMMLDQTKFMLEATNELGVKAVDEFRKMAHEIDQIIAEAEKADGFERAYTEKFGDHILKMLAQRLSNNLQSGGGSLVQVELKELVKKMPPPPGRREKAAGEQRDVEPRLLLGDDPTDQHTRSSEPRITLGD